MRCFDIGDKRVGPGWTLKIKSAEFIKPGLVEMHEVISLLDDKTDPMAEARGLRFAMLCRMMFPFEFENNLIATNIPNSKQSSESSLKIVKHSRSHL